MKSQIRDIRTVVKGGAHGNPNATGVWIYGRRPDGRTVACQHNIRSDGSVVISSTWRSPSCKPHEVEVCKTEFTKSEWEQIEQSEAAWLECNRILDARS